MNIMDYSFSGVVGRIDGDNKFGADELLVLYDKIKDLEEDIYTKSEELNSLKSSLSQYNLGVGHIIKHLNIAPHTLIHSQTRVLLLGENNKITEPEILKT